MKLVASDLVMYMSMMWTRTKHQARMGEVRPEDLMAVEFCAFVSYSYNDVNCIQKTALYGEKVKSSS